MSAGKLRLTIWRAGYAERCKSGSEGKHDGRWDPGETWKRTKMESQSSSPRHRISAIRQCGAGSPGHQYTGLAEPFGCRCRPLLGHLAERLFRSDVPQTPGNAPPRACPTGFLVSWCATICIILQENDGLYWKMAPAPGLPGQRGPPRVAGPTWLSLWESCHRR